MTETSGQHFFAEALARARECRSRHDLAGALRELRIGLDVPADYSLATTAARFLDNTCQGTAPSGYPARRVALIGADTLTFLQPVLRALAFRDGWWPEFYESPFGSWRQEILEGDSALRKFQPEITLILRGWRSLAPGTTEVGALIGEETALMQRAAKGLGLVIWPGFDLPEEGSALRHVLPEVNQRLKAALPPGMLWADFAEAQQLAGAPLWHDERLWEAVRQHPAPAGCVAVVEAWLALLRAGWGRMRKVLVTDLDNVLWGGVVGEDGVEGITCVGAYADYQKYLVELRERGVLLAICSKNNEADAREVFSKRSLLLTWDSFVGRMVNWEDKAANLCALSKKLKLGLDSFVFVDDNPVERARVRQALPEVAVPEIADDTSTYVCTLRQRRFFDNLSISKEDRNRAAAYQANELRDTLRAESATLETFLVSLKMTAEYGPLSEETLDRAEQLLARTNQWNLTTRRHDRAVLTGLMSQPDAVARWFRLRDCYGDHGLVGLWILKPGEAGVLEIDSWVMSCRVIARGLEEAMFNLMLESARNAGAQRLRGIYRPTVKNSLVKNWLPKLGFMPDPQSVEAGTDAYVLEISQAQPRPHFIGGIVAK